MKNNRVQVSIEVKCKHRGNVLRNREAGLPVSPMFGGTQGAQAEVPGACLRVGNPQFGDISRGIHREEKSSCRFCTRRKQSGGEKSNAFKKNKQ